MSHHTAPPPRVPQRVVAIRSSFAERPRSKLRGQVAVALLVFGLGQFTVWICHLVWLAEVSAWTLLRHR